MKDEKINEEFMDFDFFMIDNNYLKQVFTCIIIQILFKCWKNNQIINACSPILQFDMNTKEENWMLFSLKFLTFVQIQPRKLRTN
jgi:hypothetical protein